jgi:hypothetical protein
MAYTGAVGLILTVVALFSDMLSLHSAPAWLLLLAIVVTSAFGIYSFAYYFFGSDARRQVQVIVSAFAFLVLGDLIESRSAWRLLVPEEAPDRSDSGVSHN